MIEDRWGHDLTTTSHQAVAAFDSALIDMMEYRQTMGGQVKAALEADPDFLMGLCLRGYMMMQFGSQAVLAKVREAIAAARKLSGDATWREQRHLEALEAWSEGHIRKARGIWQEIVIKYPRDLLALRLHHFMSFWQGDRQGLRNLPVGVIAAVDETLPGYEFVLSMVSFGMEECGEYSRAEEYGRRSVSLNSNDLWGIHAVAHVLEMQTRHKEGTDWLDQPFGAWDDRNPFKDHVWWHAALFSLELGDYDRVLDVYDREVKADDAGFYLDVQNSASMLMRLELCGVNVGDRWENLAELAKSRTGDHVMPFTDAHFMLALVGAKRHNDAAAYLASQKAFGQSDEGDAASTTRELGVPLSEGLLYYGKGAYAQATDKLLAIRNELAPLGGSHAQQDVFQQVLIDAAIKAGRNDLAGHLLRERTILRPNSHWAPEKLAQIGAN